MLYAIGFRLSTSFIWPQPHCRSATSGMPCPVVYLLTSYLGDRAPALGRPTPLLICYIITTSASHRSRGRSSYFLTRVFPCGHERGDEREGQKTLRRTCVQGTSRQTVMSLTKRASGVEPDARRLLLVRALGEATGYASLCACVKGCGLCTGEAVTRRVYVQKLARAEFVGPNAADQTGLGLGLCWQTFSLQALELLRRRRSQVII